MKVFLGGTCNNSKWRNKLIPMLHIDYFNPVVKTWTKECQIEELKQRKECDYILYVITPKMEGVYSIAEVVDDSNKQPNKTILYIMKADDGMIWKNNQTKSLEAVLEMVKCNGIKVCDSLYDTAKYLNSKV